MSNKKNRAKARAARAEQTIAKLRTELRTMRSKLENARMSHEQVLRKLDETVSVLQAEEKYLKPWRITVDGLMRGGMRFNDYLLSVRFDPMLCLSAFKYMPQNDRYYGIFQDYSIEMRYLCEQIAREAENVLRSVVEKDNTLAGRVR